MTNESETSQQPDLQDAVAMPAPTIAPLVLSLGLTLLAAGVVTSLAFLLVGGALLVVGLGLWISQLLPGRGHVHERFVTAELRPRPVTGTAGTVEPLRPGVPGYRFRLPERVHPISAGIKGGIVGGLIMPIPALAYGLWSGHGIWYPINLLAGMVLPGVDRATLGELEQLHVGLLVLGVGIHTVMSITVGLLYGVLMPTLPFIPQPIAWGGLLMPLLWSGTSFALMGSVEPMFYRSVDWPWFVISQFIFGVVSAIVFMRGDRLRPIRAGLMGGLVGGLLMPIPAVLWGLISGRGTWYPINLLAAMVLPQVAKLSPEELSQFHMIWFLIGFAIHAVLSLSFGALYGLLIERLPLIPGPLAWGGMLMPLVWTGLSYSLMGVVNPLLQQHVDWPWFVISQFIFGVAASMVVVRSQKVVIPPAGQGPDRIEEWVMGTGGEPS